MSFARSWGLKKRKRNPGSEPRKTAAAPAGQRQFRVAPQCFEDLRHWVQTAPKTADRIMRLMTLTLRDPFTGIGKPELLSREDGTWSRRITDEHRLTYRVTSTDVHFIQARFHYSR
jgi:toxin YoeB